MDSSVSFESLWSIISETRTVYSHDVVGQELQALKTKFSKGILYFDCPDKDSNTSGKDAHTLFVGKIAKFLEVAYSIADEIFTSYLVFSFRGTHQSLSTLLSADRYQQALLVSVWKFYYSERLYLLMCLRWIIVKHKDESYPYHELFQSFVGVIASENDLLASLIGQLKRACSVPVSYQTERYASQHSGSSGFSLQHAWVSNMMKELLQLLQCLMAVVEHLQRPDAAQLAAILSSCASHGFGCRPSYAHLFVDQHRELILSVGVLEAVLFVQCLRLDRLAGEGQGATEEQPLPMQPDTWRLVDKLLLGLGGAPLHGLLLLAWLVYVFASPQPSPAGAGRVKALLAQVGRLDVIGFVEGSLMQLAIVRSGFVAGVVRRQLFQLLSALVQLFETERFCRRRQLVALVAQLLALPANAAQLWHGSTGLHVVLQEAVACFPARLELLQLCTGLLQSGPASVQRVIDLLSHVPYWAESVSSVPGRLVHSSLDSSSGATVLTLQADYQPLHSALVLAAGTCGTVSGRRPSPPPQIPGQQLPLDEDQQQLVSWRCPHNGWQFCMSVLDELLTREVHLDLGALQRCKKHAFLVIELLCALLRHGSRDHALQVRFLVTAIMSALGGHFSIVSDESDFFANCISLLSEYVKVDPLFVWKNMENFRLLPSGTSSKEFVLESGKIGELIESRECVSQSYPLTCALLDLLVNSVAEPSVLHFSSFRSSLAFVLCELFPSHVRWHYRAVSQRLSIGSACLRLFHRLLEAGEAGGGAVDGARQCSEAVLQHLLHEAAGATLVDMVLTGEARVSLLLDQQTHWQTGDGLLCIQLTQMALSLLNRLLLCVSPSGPAGSDSRQLSALERQLTALPAGGTRPHPLLAIGQYVFHAHSPHLPALALRLMLRLARLFPMSLLAAFGADASAICDVLLTRLRSECEDVNVKRAIVDFVGSCAHSQPGLLQRLIGTGGASAGHGDAGEAGFLDVVLALLKQHRASGSWSSPLLASTVAAVRALWQVRCVAAIQHLCRDEAFWPCVIAPLLAAPQCPSEAAAAREPGGSHCPVGVAAEVLCVLTLQLFHFGRGSEGFLDSALSTLFDSERRPLLQWSRLLLSLLAPPDGAPGGACDGGSAGGSNVAGPGADERAEFVRAWSEWCVVTAETSFCWRQLDSGQRGAILMHLCGACLTRLEHGCDGGERPPSAVHCLLELLTLLAHRWADCISDQFIEHLCALVDLMAARCRHMSRRARVAILTLVAHVAHCEPQRAPPACRDQGSWTQLCLAPLVNMLLVSMTDPHCALSAVLEAATLTQLLVLNPSGSWQLLLTERQLLPALLDLLGSCVARAEHVQLCSCLLQLAVCATGKSELLVASVCGEQVARHVCLPLCSLLATAACGVEWRRVWTLSVQLMATLQVARPHLCWPHSVSFVSVHSGTLCDMLLQLRHSLSDQSLLEAEATARLLVALTSSGDAAGGGVRLWRDQHAESLAALVRAACQALAVCLAHVQRPGCAALLVEPRPAAATASGATTPAVSRHSARRAVIGERVERVGTHTERVLQRLLRVACLCQWLLLQAGPPLPQLLAGDGHQLPVQQQPLVEASLAVGSEDQLSFGALLSSASVCVRHLARDGGALSLPASSPAACRPSQPDTALVLERSAAAVCLQQSLLLMLSEACLLMLSRPPAPRSRQLLSHVSLTAGPGDDDVVLVCRELHAELVAVMDNCCRPLRRSLSMSPISSRLAAVASCLSVDEQRFMTVLTRVANRVLK